MTNPDPRTAHLDKLVRAARAVITYQVGLPVGCERVNKLLYWLRPYQVLDYPVFGEYLHATAGLPLGSERLECTWEALRRFDIQLEAANSQYRERVFEACYEILERFAAPASRPRQVDE